MKNVLIVGAHYDDAELGCAGTAAKLIKEKGCNVFKLTLTNNETRFVERNIIVNYESSIKQSANACKILGVKEITSFEPAVCSELCYSKEIMQRIEKVIFDYNIDTVFTHFGSDMNQDHVAASCITLTAARHCSNVFQYQSNGYILDNVFYPTFFFDISQYVEQKKLALEQYGEEHNRMNKLFQINIERNHIWGYANEVEYAEGFHIVKYLEK